jgi:hypothetical protein
VYKSHGIEKLKTLDNQIEAVCPTDKPTIVDIDKAVELLKLAYANFEFDDSTDDDRAAHIAALEHLSRTCKKPELKGKVLLLIAKDREVRRYREEGRFSNAPDTKQQKDLARDKAEDVPVLMLLRQKGALAQGWRDLPFWWPVIVTPRSAITAIFATDEAVVSNAPTPAARVERALSTDEVA